MMKKRIILCLLTGITFYLCPVLLSAQSQNCQAPPPSWVMMTNSSPTSITLAWAPTLGPSVSQYIVDGYDVTEGSDIPTVVVSGSTAACIITNLKGGHLYSFDISASYCTDGQAQALSTNFQGGSGTIIVTQIIELHNPCTPGNVIYPQSGSSYNFSISQSSMPPPGPYTNALVAELSFEQAIVHFGIAQYQNRMFIGQRTAPLTNYNFDFFPESSDDDVVYLERETDGKRVLTAEYVDYSVSSGKATVRITFDEPLTYFKYCAPNGVIHGDPNPPGERSDGSSDNSLPESENMIPSAPAPNPFSESVSLGYSLSSELPVEIGVYDPIGRLVRTVEQNASKPAGQYNATIDGAGLSAGVYFLRVRIGENSKVFSLVKHD
ncbi:MAG: T9SS type A sorting domain-containing protein [Lewinellaceae bacterium]|nr:T9SS type A sorting domain-containing protein [Lewinellaceae bacterium]